MPPLGGLHRNIAIPFGGGKTRIVWLPDIEKNFKDIVQPFTRNRPTGVWQTDRRMDGWTDGHLVTA